MTKPLPALFAVLLSAGVAFAKDKPSSSSKKSREHEHEKSQKSSKSPPSVSLESVDLKTSKAVVRVGGVSKPPDARLFSFHDDRSRHFIALYARCEPAPTRTVISAEGPDAVKSETHNEKSDDEFLCELDLPRPYLRANVRGMTVHLHSKEVVADEAEVTTRWAAARALVPNLASASRESADALRDARDPIDALDDPHQAGALAPPDDPGIKLPRRKVKLAKPTQEGSEETETETGFDDE